MSVSATIERKLRDAFDPHQLQVEDQSDRHRGHMGWREGGETHFHVAMVATVFAGKSRVERQRLVHQALREELAGPVHALSLTLTAPDEA